jgi:hypothetical protein
MVQVKAHRRKGTQVKAHSRKTQWIQKEVNSSGFKEGSLTRIARRSGMSAMDYARKHYHDKGKIGAKSRFAVNAQKRKK